MLGNKILLKCSDEGQFCSSLHTFGIRRECQEDYIKVGESKVEESLRLDYRIVHKIMCSLQGSGLFLGASLSLIGETCFLSSWSQSDTPRGRRQKLQDLLQPCLGVT